tara:strand:+ start:94 stop:513 length:420 start_codon:yes stop_codon:yes gene_type:complete
MNRFLIAFSVAGLTALSSTALAQDDDFDDEMTSLPGSVLVMRGLDKITAETRDFEINIGESYNYGPLTITPSYCRKRPPEETPETFAFLQIVDRRSDGTGADSDGDTPPIFSGWMFGSNPALNPLEHAVYDVWVIDCRD